MFWQYAAAFGAGSITTFALSYLYLRYVDATENWYE